MHSKQWHYSPHRDFQNCYSTRRSPTGFFSSNPNSNSNSNSTCAHYITLHYNPENSPSRIQFYMQKTKSSSSTTTTLQRFQKRNSTYRRQRDLLEIHPCVLQDPPRTFQTFQSFQTFQTFQTFQSFMTFQPFQAILQILQVPVSPGNPTHSSILQLECIFYSLIGFHRKLHRVPVEQLQTLHSSKKGRCCDIGQIDIFSRIELITSIVLSSDNTNCKNDIQ